MFTPNNAYIFGAKINSLSENSISLTTNKRLGHAYGVRKEH